jgi:hypothetical protein
MYLIQICLQETEWNKLPAVFRITWKSLEAIGWKILYAGMETDEREVIIYSSEWLSRTIRFSFEDFLCLIIKIKITMSELDVVSRATNNL